LGKRSVPSWKPTDSIRLYGARAKQLKDLDIDQTVTLIVKGKVKSLSDDRTMGREVSIEVSGVKRESK